jgi:hypothetical protein
MWTRFSEADEGGFLAAEHKDKRQIEAIRPGIGGALLDAGG